MSGSGAHDLEAKAPENLTTHEELKPEDSKSTIGSSEHGASSHGSSVTDQEGFKHGKNKFGETRAEETKRIAIHLSSIVDKAIERIHPFLEMIKTHVDKAKRTEKEDIDEEALVENLKPLIEKGTAILQETYGAIKAVDPDDKIAHAAQHRAKVSEATPEEQHLAQGLTTLAGDVTKVIEEAKDLIKDMPHAQNQLGPLLEMFGEPLFQILGAVGMLLNGVLSLVVNILDSLGLGGIIRGLINGLGIGKLLKGVGLGKWLDPK